MRTGFPLNSLSLSMSTSSPPVFSSPLTAPIPLISVRIAPATPPAIAPVTALTSIILFLYFFSISWASLYSVSRLATMPFNSSLADK